MTSFASFRCRLVEEHETAVHRFLQRMARRASDVFVSPFERESGLVMIEERRLPFIAVVASCAIVGPGAELVGMRILMAIAAIDGGFRKVHMPHVEFHVRWLVAVDAGHRAMRSQEREVRLRVIESCQIFPLTSRVTCLASQRLCRLHRAQPCAARIAPGAHPRGRSCNRDEQNGRALLLYPTSACGIHCKPLLHGPR